LELNGHILGIAKMQESLATWDGRSDAALPPYRQLAEPKGDRTLLASVGAPRTCGPCVRVDSRDKLPKKFNVQGWVVDPTLILLSLPTKNVFSKQNTEMRSTGEAALRTLTVWNGCRVP
jgi:hypothetical protein